MRGGVIALVVMLAPALASAQLAAYGSWQLLRYDGHNHPGLLETVAQISEGSYDPSVKCTHSYHWCDEIFAAARAGGLDALIQSHHTQQVRAVPQQSLAIWKSLPPNFAHAFGRQEVYPTHPDGIPLAVSGGHTDDERLALWQCAQAANDPGSFLAFYGGEYSAPGGLSEDCVDTHGTALCGGHKILVYGQQPAITCSAFPDSSAPSHICATEGAAYDLVRDGGGVVFAAHPTSIQVTDWTRFDPDNAPGGIDDDIVVGYEFPRVMQAEDVACVDDSKSCGFRQVLARGYHVHPTFGGDNHHHFAGSGEGCFNDLGLPSLGAQGACWVLDFDRQSFLDAQRAHRCFWAGSNSGVVDAQWTLDGAAMGSSIPRRYRYLGQLYIRGVGAADFETWDFVCGRHSGGDGGATIVASGACHNQELCTGAPIIQDDGHDWCYARVLSGSGQVEVLTAPIWFAVRVPLFPFSLFD